MPNNSIAEAGQARRSKGGYAPRPDGRASNLIIRITERRSALQTLAIIALLIALRIASVPSASGSYIALACYALFGRRQALEALTLSFAFTQLNEDMFPIAQFSAISRYIVVAAAMASVLLRMRTPLRSAPGQGVIFLTFALGGFILLHSVLFSAMPAVSFLKGATWLSVILTALFAWRSMPDTDRKRSAHNIFLILAAIVVTSLVASFSPAGYLPRTSYLRGVLGHSQALAAVAACITVWAFLGALAHRRPPWWLFGLGALGAYVVFETQARTAIVAVSVSVSAVIVLELLRGGSLRKRLLPALRLEWVGIIGVVSVLMALSQSAMISDLLSALLGKGENSAAGGLLDEYQKSRGMLIDAMWTNLSRDAIGGIGFGIASNPWEMDVETIWGLPFGAVVEKGVTPLAIWEELGFIGLGLFCLWVLGFVTTVLQRDAVRLAVLLVILLINLGEASLMSAGGIGLFQLILLGWIASGTTNSAAPSGEHLVRAS